MKREIQTRILTPEEQKEELVFFISYFLKAGYESCSVLFGYAWGLEYYATGEWQSERVAMSALLQKIQAVEALEIGQFGADDLLIEVAGLEFRFCHESDVHIGYEAESAVVEDYWQRWSGMGYAPAEYLKTSPFGLGELIRSSKKA